ncbi:MAG: hypothetical protein QOJ40_176 [Verrucomicrobiota bacterium]
MFAEETLRMSIVITFGAVILVLALFAMLIFSRWRLRTIAILLVGVAMVYVGVSAWFSRALDRALKRHTGRQQVDSVPHKVVDSDHFQVPTNGVDGVKTNAP